MLELQVNIKPAMAQLRSQLQGLPPAKRKRLLKSMGETVLTASRARVTASQNIDGSSWAPRKRGKKKMLRRSGRLLKITRHGADVVALGYASPVQASISLAKHDGLDEIYRVKRGALSARSARAVGRGKPSTAAQARELVALGFEVRSAGEWQTTSSGRVYVKGARVRANAKWIRANLGRSQAGAILRTMRGDKRKSEWVIPNTPRSFLGVSTADMAALTLQATNAFAQQFNGANP